MTDEIDEVAAARERHFARRRKATDIADLLQPRGVTAAIAAGIDDEGRQAAAKLCRRQSVSDVTWQMVVEELERREAEV